MATFFYLARRFVAIALGLALTGYSAWASWTHFHDLIGPLAAISAASMLIFSEYAWHDRQWVHLGALGVLGALAAVISGSVVLERVSATNEARTHQARSANLPRVEARKALNDARETLKAAEAAVRAETRDGGCRRICEGFDTHPRRAIGGGFVFFTIGASCQKCAVTLPDATGIFGGIRDGDQKAKGKE